MWESLKRLSRGRISLRGFSLFATSLLMAFFVIIGPLSGVAHAEDAARNPSNPEIVTFKGDMYYQLDQTDANNDGVLDVLEPLNLSNSKDTDGYVFKNSRDNKAAFLLTTGAGSALTATQAIYVSYHYTTPPDTYTSPTTPQTVAIGQASGSYNATSNCDSATTGAVGWIICPLTTFFAKGMDEIYKIISDFLVVSSVTGDTNSSIYRLWSIVRDITNVCFIIALLVMVYSYLTSIGVSNYEIKKMIPRLIIAAILVNISYIVSAAAVDLSNALGVAVHNLFNSVTDSVNQGAMYDNINIPTWQSVTTAVLAGGGAIVAGVAVYQGALWLLLPFLLTVLLSALVSLLILAVRQALIVILIIISPLAFVAFVTPNTEKYFDKWRGSFTTMLLLFPIFSAVFSGAQLAGLAIVQNANGSILILILGMAVQVAPLAITPLLLKFSGGLVGKIAGVVNDPNRGLIDRSRKWASGMANSRRLRVLGDNIDNRVGARPSRNWLNPMAYSRAIYTSGRIREAEDKDNEELLTSHASNAYHSRVHNDQYGRYARQRRRNEQAYRYKKTDGLYQESSESDYEKRWQEHVDSDDGRYLRHLQRNTHVAKGEGKVREDSRMAAYERALQNRIATNADLRSRKVSDIVDGGVSKTISENIEAEGNQALQEIIRSDANIQERLRDTHHRTKTAEKIKVTIDNDNQAHWDELSRTDDVIRNLHLEATRSADNAKLQEEQLNTLVANIRASGSSAPGLSAADSTVADGLLQIYRDTRTEAEKQHNAKIEQDKGYLEALSRDEAMRLEAGGIRGADGAKTVFARTIASSRKEFEDRVGETTQLMKHFNPSSAQRQEVTRGNSVSITKDGVTYEIDADDKAVRLAFLNEQLKTGSADQIMEIVDSSGVGGVNEAFNTTILDGVIANGLSNRFLFWGGKTLDDIGQGRYTAASESTAIIDHVSSGKVTTEKLASQDALALQHIFNVINDTAAMNAMSDEKREKFTTNFQNLKYEAWKIIHDSDLSSKTAKAAKDELAKYMEKPPAGYFDKEASP